MAGQASPTACSAARLCPGAPGDGVPEVLMSGWPASSAGGAGSDWPSPPASSCLIRVAPGRRTPPIAPGRRFLGTFCRKPGYNLRFDPLPEGNQASRRGRLRRFLGTISGAPHGSDPVSSEQGRKLLVSTRYRSEVRPAATVIVSVSSVVGRHPQARAGLRRCRDRATRSRGLNSSLSVTQDLQRRRRGPYGSGCCCR